MINFFPQKSSQQMKQTKKDLLILNKFQNNYRHYKSQTVVTLAMFAVVADVDCITATE